MKNSRVLLIGVSALLSTAAAAFGELQVVIDHNANDDATEHFKFKSVPSPAPDNAAAKAKFVVVTGEADDNSGNVAVLNDGKLPTEDDQPGSNFFFTADTEGGRLQADLGGVIAVKAVNTYSWHPNTRGPQVYKLYASDGTADGFNAKPGEGVKPEQTGWKLIASVDTRPKSGESGGQYGVSITDSTGTLGQYRYLLFDVVRTETDDTFGNTFYSEINVIGEGGAAPQAAAPAATPAAGSGVPVPLETYFNNAGISADGAEFSGGFDDNGATCSSNLLGSVQVWKGVKFNLGSASVSNVVACSSQTVNLPAGKYASLQLLAAAVNGDQASQTFTVAYSDTDAAQTITQSISDWFTSEGYSGETQVVKMDHRNQSDGGKDDQEFNVYGYSFSLNATNTVKSLKLPDNVNVRVLAITLVPADDKK